MGVDVDGEERVRQILDALSGPELMRLLRGGLRAAGEHLRSLIAIYPSPASHPVAWVSERQRRWWFASRGKANLPPYYVRKSDAWSQDLLNSWSVEVTDDAVVVGTRCTYAPYVQSEESQTAQHRATGWKTDKEAVREFEDSDVLGTILERVIAQLISRL